MSWSHSLRSPSLSPPPQDAALPPVQLEHDNAGTSLWDNEGDRNDPIDIANVWEPGIKFKETPFTIAKRNGMRKESNYQDKQGTGKGKIVSKDASLPRSTAPLPQKTPTRSTARSDTTVEKKLATPAKPAIAELSKPSLSLETPKSQLATPAQCLPPPAPPVKPKATFTRPTLDTTASTSRLNLNEPVIHDHLDVRSTTSSAGATISKEAKESFHRKESSMFKAPRPVEKNTVQIEASASQSGVSRQAFNRVPPREPATSSASSSTPDFEIYADSSQILHRSTPPTSPATLGSSVYRSTAVSPSYSSTPSHSAPTQSQTTTRTQTQTQVRNDASIGSNFFRFAPPTREISTTVQTPSQNLSSLRPISNQSQPSVNQSAAFPAPIPPPFCSQSSTDLQDVASISSDNAPRATPNQPTTRSKLSRFLNPSRPSNFTIDHSEFPSNPPMTASTISHKRPFEPPHTPMTTSNKFELPIQIPPKRSKKLMDFTPIEPIREFQERKKIKCTAEFSKGVEEEEEEEDFFGNGKRFLDSGQNLNSTSSNSQAKEFRGDEEEGREKVRFGTELRSFGKGFRVSSSTTGINGRDSSSPSISRRGGRGRARGRVGRGGGLGRGPYGRRGMDEVYEEAGGEEEKLKRLYRSLG